jgi:hypothetical protein
MSAAAKCFFWDFFSLNERSYHETYKFKILSLSDVSVTNAEDHNSSFFECRSKKLVSAAPLGLKCGTHKYQGSHDRQKNAFKRIEVPL